MILSDPAVTVGGEKLPTFRFRCAVSEAELPNLFSELGLDSEKSRPEANLLRALKREIKGSDPLADQVRTVVMGGHIHSATRIPAHLWNTQAISNWHDNVQVQKGITLRPGSSRFALAACLQLPRMEDLPEAHKFLQPDPEELVLRASKRTKERMQERQNWDKTPRYIVPAGNGFCLFLRVTAARRDVHVAETQWLRPEPQDALVLAGLPY